MHTPYADHTRRHLQDALARAEADAMRRQPGLVQRNWDHESNPVTIDHDEAATDLATFMADYLPDGEMAHTDARAAVLYALEGNTDAVLI